ncbi:hypothetical protein [Nocardia testacea]
MREYRKHFLGLSGNVGYFVEELEAAEVSRCHYNLILEPENIVAVDRP